MSPPEIHLHPGERMGTARCGCTLNRDYERSESPAFFFCNLHTHAARMKDFIRQVLQRDGEACQCERCRIARVILRDVSPNQTPK